MLTIQFMLILFEFFVADSFWIQKISYNMKGGGKIAWRVTTNSLYSMFLSWGDIYINFMGKNWYKYPPHLFNICKKCLFLSWGDNYINFMGKNWYKYPPYLFNILNLVLIYIYNIIYYNGFRFSVDEWREPVHDEWGELFYFIY